VFNAVKTSIRTADSSIGLDFYEIHQTVDSWSSVFLATVMLVQIWRRVNFYCRVHAVRLFGGQETEDSTTATKMHHWNPHPAQWTPPPHTHKPWLHTKY